MKNSEWTVGTIVNQKDFNCECGKGTFQIYHVSNWHDGTGVFYSQCDVCNKRRNIQFTEKPKSRGIEVDVLKRTDSTIIFRYRVSNAKSVMSNDLFHDQPFTVVTDRTGTFSGAMQCASSYPFKCRSQKVSSYDYYRF